MKNTISFFIVSVILVYYLLLQNNFLLAQTIKTTHPDTSKKAAQKLQPEESKPKLELPDVLIYGTDRSVRISGDKLDRSYKDIKLVAPIITYQPLTEDLKLESQKGYFQSPRKGIYSRTLIQLDGGRYQQFGIEASRWQEAENYNYSVKADYERSNGQYENSQYYQSAVQALFGIRLSSDFIISSEGNFGLFNYGLYGARLENLQRKISGGKIKIDNQWSIATEQSAEFSVYFQQHNSKDDDNAHYESKLVESNIGLISTYQTKYHSIPIFIRALYDYQKLNIVTIDSINYQEHLQLKSWLSLKIKNYVIIKPALLIEKLDLSNSFSAYQFSPDVEIIVTPMTKIGILLKAARELNPINYFSICEKNPFVSYETNFVAIKKNMELKFGIEYNPYSIVSLSAEIIRQNWKNYAYWLQEAENGLFQLNAVDKVNLTILNFQSKFTFSSKFNFDAGIQMNFDKIKDDSLTENVDHLPYLERFRLPFSFEYNIDKTTKTLLTFLLIGPRYVDFNNVEQLSTFGLLSLYFEKQLIKNISIFAEGNNLLDQKYEFWQNYPGMGFYFEAGLKGNW